MECTKCHRLLTIDNFSYKNIHKKIYYLHCNKCREKLMANKNKKQQEKEQYDITKKTNIIQCDCGKKYVAFRDYHIYRHVNSKCHLNYLNNSNDIKVKDN